MSDSDSSSSSAGEEEQPPVVVAPVPVKKKGRKKKVQEGPKKPMSAYMFFCKERRVTLGEEHPGTSFTEMGKKLGAEWKTMGVDDKEKFSALAKEDKERYAREGGGPKKKKKVSTGPKRPLSAYMFFSQEMRPLLKEEDASLGFADLGREIGARWKSLEDKTKYLNLADQDKQRYKRDLDAVSTSQAVVDVGVELSEEEAPVARQESESDDSDSD